jgi:hypothetical protein
LSGWVREQWIGLDRLIEEIDRVTLRDEPYVIVGPLEQVLHEGFLLTQAAVSSPAHPHTTTYQPTGRLAASGRTRSAFDGKMWVGEIIYGDETTHVTWSGGEGNYAIFEMARGGIHDWYAELPALGDRYIDAILDHYRGRGR